MKINFSHRTIAVFLTLIFVFGLIPPTVFAQTNPPLPSGEVRGFNRAVFDSHFSRADREINPERWLAEAKIGITQAISAWELIASGLYENPLIFDEAKAQIEKWSNEELEARFTKWLIGRFFGGAAGKSTMDLSAAFDEIQKKYSWHLDDEGNIIYDDKTGDPLIIRPGEEDREFSRDLLSWRNEAKNNVNTNRNSFNNALLRFYPELLAYIPEELRESMDPLLNESGSSANGIIKREFENISAREERIFTNRRTRDIWSLRKKSDEEAAGIFTERLIAETEDACAKGIEELNARIEEASAGNGDLVLLGEEWLQLYKEQFERGLKAWEEAEERFFVRRIEWEQDSIKLFSEGEEKWLAAFNQFEEERKKWELKAKDLLNSGEQLFINLSENLEKNITEAKKEFEANMKMRIGAGESKVKAIIDMYLICASAALTTRENVLFWLKQYDKNNKRDPREPGFSDWLLGEQNKIDESTFTELKNSYDLYASYIEKALDARDRILTDYAELIGTGALKDILAPDASSEDFCLDEYQIALIKSKALVSYWERKTAIAEAVIAYADEIDAGRMTASEGIHNWENAKSAYYDSIAVYEIEIKKLNEIGVDIQEQQKILDTLSVDLAKAEEKLNILNHNLLAYVASSMIDTKIFASEDLEDIYKLIQNNYIDFQKTGEEAVYKNILEYGMKWAILEQKENAEYLLNIFINGDGEDIPSLSELQRNADKGNEYKIDLNIRLAGIYLFSDTFDGQLRDADSTFSGADWYSLVKGINLSENEKTALYGEKLGEKLSADYKKSFQLFLEKHLSLELEILLNYLNEYPELDNFNFELSEVGKDNTENFSYFYEILSALKNRLETGNGCFTENGQENEFINFFISGGSLFTGLEENLSSYYNDYLYCMNLLNLYNNYSLLGSFSQKEIWQDTNDSLNSLFSGYSIQTENIFPDIQSLLDAIKNKPGKFLDNAVQFMLDFDNCFTYVPKWLEIEIDQYKAALIDYFAAYSLQNDIQPSKNSADIENDFIELFTIRNALYEYANSKISISDEEIKQLNDILSEMSNKENKLNYLYALTISMENFSGKVNEKHWRQYLTGEYLNEYLSDTEPLITFSSSWKEGILKDAFFDTVYYTNRLNDSFILFSNYNLEIENEDSKMFLDEYISKSEQINDNFNLLKHYFTNLIIYAKAYDISKLTIEEAKEKIKIQSEAIAEQESIFNSLREEYLLKAEMFINTGNLYDNQYSISKKAYDDIDKKRFEYEKQDAIHRWASTAYLGTDNLNYDDCKSHLEKAQTVLTVLSDLYNNESNRPYDNSEYDTLYAKYEQSFNQKIRTLDTLDTLKNEIMREKENNKTLFKDYQDSLNKLENLDKNYAEFTATSDSRLMELKDMITVNNGLLAFSRDSSMNLYSINSSTSAILDEYFNKKDIGDNEDTKISQFEEALRGLTERMNIYFNDSNKQKQWGLARDYLIVSLLDINNIYLPGYPPAPFLTNTFLYNNYKGIEQLTASGNLGKLPMLNKSLYEYIFDKGIIFFKDNECSRAWNALSIEEKADLEFYVILTLSNNSGYVEGFSRFYTQEIYDLTYTFVQLENTRLKRIEEKWYYNVPDSMLAATNTVMSRVNTGLNAVRDSVNDWKSEIKKILLSINDLSSSYAKSCKKINLMEGKKEDGEFVIWDDIYKSLTATEKFDSIEIDYIKSYWEQMQLNSEDSYKNVSKALSALLDWSKNEEKENIKNLNDFWSNEENKQKENENAFQTAVNEYLNGTGKITAVKNAAKKAYGNNTASWKNHFTNLYTTLQDNLALYLETKNDHYTEFEILGNEITSLTMKTMENRYIAELAAREFEWNQMRLDISDKYNEWINSAALILENGRTDWNNGSKKIEEAYKQWNSNFKNEYNRVSNEWAEAYLAGLEDKEKWLEQAADAANQASMESLLSLIGTEGERLSRFIDTREPFGIRDAIPETETLMAELLQASGITNMVNAFNSLNNIAGTASSVVRQGMGGISIWNASLVKTTASDLARKTNTEIADNEARKLARIARMNADEAIKSIIDNVDLANKSFNKSMDNQFILSGYWRKNGDYYEKDIIKGSTLTKPVISETVYIAGYNNYKMEPVTLKTNLDENELAKYDSYTINTLLRNAYKEIEEIISEIFGGKDEKSETIKGKDLYNDYYSKILGNEAEGYKGVMIGKVKEMTHVEDRELSPGKFGAHIGYVPSTNEFNKGDNRKAIFHDEGSGELGRLMSDYIYWSIIDNIGINELNLPVWDKRIWDDSDTFFKAPTIRSAAQLVGSIAAAVVTSVVSFGTGLPAVIGMVAANIGINTADDLIFGALDVAGGYKSIEEAGFEFGKALAINTVNGVVSGVFGGLGETVGTDFFSKGLTKTAAELVGNSPVKGVLVKTAMTAIQVQTTGTITSALSAITYSNSAGFGFNNEIYRNGIKNMLTNTVTSMAGAAVSGTLQAINSGFSMEKLTGFSKLNTKDISKLNNFVGSMAEQGVNYAMGGDFTLNLLNLSIFQNDKINSGLLELHFGRNGTTMNFGTGGANVSIDNLISAYRGTQVWNVNNQINKYINNNDFNSSITLRAQYGYGDDRQKDQLWDILDGKTIINTDANGNFDAETTIVDGKRVINLAGYKQDMSENEQMLLAIILGHETYRDGYVTEDNNIETRIATLAHTEMAIRMGKDIQGLKFSDNLISDIMAYSLGSDFFNDYVDNIYDSSADYWKLMRNGTLVNDNSGWLTDENGKPILNANGEKIGAKGIETGLLNILFGGTSGVGYETYSDEQIKLAQSLMITAKMKYIEGEKGNIRERSWTGNVTGQSLNMQRVMEGAGNTVASAVFARYYEDTAISTYASSIGKDIGNINKNLVSSNALERFTKELLPSVMNFYQSMGHFLDVDKNFKVTGYHDERDPRYQYPNYENNAHFGTDWANGKSGDPIYMGISGSVIGAFPNTNGNGNWMVVEYGYMFEGSFFGSGIYGEYMHMEKKPEYKNGAYLNSKQVIGTVGNTGRSSGPHLHYTIYTLDNYTFSQTTLRVLLNNNISNTVVSKSANGYAGTYKSTAKKVTYNIENYIQGLKK